MLLTTAYFPPVEYFAVLARYSAVYLEACEKYQKQSWRNRCRILTANGPMDLNFPIVHDGKSLIKEVKVDYSTPWLRRTEYAIDSAYYSSPFFEYYRDELFATLDAQPETLWELNLGIIRFFCRKIGINPEIIETKIFVAPAAACSRGESEDSREFAESQIPSISSDPTIPLRCMVPPLPCRGRHAPAGSMLQPGPEDFRYSIHPKLVSGYVAKPYWQVFREKFGFVPGLSVMDLLFNEGPESLSYLL